MSPAPLKGIIIIDLETTGLSPRYDQPTQFAAARLDENLNEIETVDILARPQNHILPSPKALVVQRRGIEEVMSAPVSHYELMARIEGVISAWGPAFILGQNSLKFDEEFLRNGFYAGLRQPYATQFNGNRRADLLCATWFVHALEPGIIAVPAGFSLGPLAAANGYAGHDAHDALGDVRATAHIVRLLAAGAPSIWQHLLDLTDKKVVLEQLVGSDFVLVVKRGAATVRAVVPIGLNPDYENDCFAIDLSKDPTPMLGLSVEELAGALAKPHALQKIRINAMPTIVGPDHPAAKRILLRPNIPPEASRWARTLCADRGFCERAVATARLLQKPYPEPVYVEDRLYSGGFFPLPVDRGVIAAFHAADPAKKRVLIDLMRDDRARQFGLRI
jgi:exodeoxyribonuclease-1